MLYCAVKTGVHVNIADMGLNVFYDLINYSAEIDAIAIAKENTALLSDLNKALEKLTADGTIDAIIAKYIK